MATLRLDPILEARRQWDGRWENGLAIAAAISVMRAQQIVLSRVDAVVGQHGLTFARFEALVLLYFTRSGSLPLGKIGERLMIHPASVTNIIDRLETQQLVQRLPHPTDRRAVLAEITEEGRQVAQAAAEAVDAVTAGIGDLSEQELKLLVDVLTRFRAAAGDFVLDGAED